MSTKHTPTPWDADSAPGLLQTADGRIIATLTPDAGDGLVPWTEAEQEANAARIVQCVNACEGMADPAHALRIVREELATVREFLRREAGEQSPETVRACYRTQCAALTYTLSALGG